jgi:hypothetical protein
LCIESQLFLESLGPHALGSINPVQPRESRLAHWRQCKNHRNESLTWRRISSQIFPRLSYLLFILTKTVNILWNTWKCFILSLNYRQEPSRFWPSHAYQLDPYDLPEVSKIVEDVANTCISILLTMNFVSANLANNKTRQN